MKRVDLKRSLTLRITLFALLLLVVAIAVTLQQAKTRIRADIERTGSTIQQLIEDEVGKTTPAFNRTLQGLDLSGLMGIGQLIHFCAAVEDIYIRPVVARCFGESDATPHPLGGLMRWLVGADTAYHTSLGKYPGIKVGELVISPNFDSEAATVWREIRNLLMITGGILLLNVLVYRPVRRALQPTEAILHALGRMEAGDLNVRLPSFELIELQRISSVFNHLADRLQLTIGDQRRLAVRLLNVREDERRHLARELHDELGQCLTSIQAEAAYARELAADSLPALTPCAEAISRTTAHMMESLQLILRELRPVGLEEFGLAASLAQLVASRNRSSHGRCQHTLAIDGEVDGLPDNLNVSLYRIVQESLTNASKHGGADRVEVALRRDARSLALSVEDNGVAMDAPVSSEGFGLLGMHERVQALGGTLNLTPRQPRGLRVDVRLPLTEGATRYATETTP
jgi:protein-histidine pros-kinase